MHDIASRGTCDPIKYSQHDKPRSLDGRSHFAVREKAKEGPQVLKHGYETAPDMSQLLILH
jgi:hypothetical protein